MMMILLNKVKLLQYICYIAIYLSTIMLFYLNV